MFKYADVLKAAKCAAQKRPEYKHVVPDGKEIRRERQTRFDSMFGAKCGAACGTKCGASCTAAGPQSKEPDRRRGSSTPTAKDWRKFLN